jgi:hypothetical protein
MNRTSPILLAVPLAVLGFCANGELRKPFVIEAEKLTVTDAHFMTICLYEAHDRLLDFLDLDRERFEQFVTIRIRVEPDLEEIGVGRSNIIARPRKTASGIALDADIVIAAPWLYDGRQLSENGHPKDRRFFAKLLVHEVATVYLDWCLGQKPEGWRLHGAPDWFKQGLEEYCGLHFSHSFWRTQGVQDYRGIVRADPSRIRYEDGIQITERYVDGAMLIAFMIDTFGLETLRNVLQSPAPDVEEAMLSELGVSREIFGSRFRTWVSAPPVE